MSDQLPPHIAYCHQVVDEVIYQNRLEPHPIRMLEPRMRHEWHGRQLIILVGYDGLEINGRTYPIRGHLTLFHAVMKADAGVIENARNRKKKNLFFTTWLTLLKWVDSHPIEPTLGSGFNPETQDGDIEHWAGPNILYFPESREPKRLILQINAQSELHRRLNEALHWLGTMVAVWRHDRFSRHLSMDGVGKVIAAGSSGDGQTGAATGRRNWEIGNSQGRSSSASLSGSTTSSTDDQ